MQTMNTKHKHSIATYIYSMAMKMSLILGFNFYACAETPIIDEHSRRELKADDLHNVHQPAAVPANVSLPLVSSY